MKKTAKDIQNEYLREWRKKNPDKVRQYNRTYWERRLAREEEAKNNAAAE